MQLTGKSALKRIPHSPDPDSIFQSVFKFSPLILGQKVYWDAPVVCTSVLSVCPATGRIFISDKANSSAPEAYSS